ncbi:MAG: type I restriction endonuclease subunit R [Nitrosopumilus sp.]|nr:type I restriction endonuclease subunit R [Nitrosopumilus sp.]
MILQGHGPEWEQSEKPALEQLIQLGFEYKNKADLDKTRESELEPLLMDRLEQAILKLNPWIDEFGIEDAIRQFKKFDTNIPIDANEIAHARIIGLSTEQLEPITVMQDLGDGNKPHTVKIIDFDKPENNDFLATNQFFLKGYKEDILPDIVIFVNGIPLVVIECKSPFVSNPINEAITNNLARYQQRKTGFERLFYYTQILVATCGTQARYAPTFASAHHYKEWRDPYPLTDDDIEQKFGRSRKQEILIGGILTKEHLLELIRNFTVYQTEENKRIKKIAKYQQFRAVQKTIHRIDSGKTPVEKGGVIWHTQGSGKSLTMFWLALKLKRIYGNPTVMIVTDRKQLDKQIHNTFKACGFPNPIQAKGRENLKEIIENNRGKTIMSTVFKFPFFKDGEAYAVSEESCFVLVDEGHRSQYGLTNAAMRAALPNAIFFAYTGTPLMKNAKTQDKFGSYIDTYKITESEADGATLPIYYESQFSDMHVQGETVEKRFERLTKDVDEKTRELARKKYANKTALAAAPDRIKRVADKIVEHYETHVRPNGLKAMIVAPSRAAAVLYKEALDDLKAPDSKIIMTSMPTDKKYGWDKYELTEGDKERYEERFKLPIEDEGLSILIVVDMLLTGFDAPILQALYLDQGLKEHTLLQAIARVNRPYGDKKTHGLIVDFWGISENLAAAYQMYDDADVQEILKPLDDAHRQLKLRYAKVMSHFYNVEKNDLDGLIAVLTPEDVREEFEHDFREFSKFMDLVLPDPEALKYQNDLRFLAKTRAAARTAFYDENLSLREIGEKVKKLIKESIQAEESVQLIPPTKIDNNNFLKLVESYGSTKTRASVIEKKARKVIEENESKNPAYYKSLRLRLEEIIEQLKHAKFEDAKSFNQLQGLLTELFTEEEKSKSIGFDTKVKFAIFSSLEKVFNKEQAKKLTFKISDSIEPLQVIEWSKKENIQKEMRVKIKDILYDQDLDAEQVQTLAVEIVDLMKANE